MKSAMSLMVFGLVAVLFAAASARAADKAGEVSNHEGTVVSATASMLVMTDNAGKEHSHTVGSDVKVTIDGKDSKLTDLKKGDKITVGTKDGKVVSVHSGVKK